MRTNIWGKIDTKKLNEAIDDYLKVSGKYDPYIIMSTETLKALRAEADTNKSIVTYYNDKAKMYEGNLIAIDDSLSLGWVDIR